MGPPLFKTIGNITDYIDSDVVNNNTYYYKITASNIIGEGDPSLETSARPSTDIVPDNTDNGSEDDSSKDDDKSSSGSFYLIISVVIIAVVIIVALLAVFLRKKS
jgi:hypothetical protein